MRKLIYFMLAVLTMASCTTTRYIPVEHVRTDTLRQTVHERDSIYLHDSTYVMQNGDTVTIERWHTVYRDRWRIDTVYQSKRDSVPVPVPVIQEVPAELTWWQITRIYLGNILLITAGALLLWKLLKK